MEKSEIERRFLIKNNILEKINLKNEIRIIQGYYHYKRLKKFNCLKNILKENNFFVDKIIRVRVEDKRRVFLTIKIGDGLIRKEYEIELDFEKELYDFLIDDKKIITKHRSEFYIKKQKIILDRFMKRYRGLKIVEIEFDDKNQAEKFIPCKDFIEITSVKELSNLNLYLSDEKKIFNLIGELYENKN